MTCPQDGQHPFLAVEGLEFGGDVPVPLIDEHVSCTGRESFEFLHHAREKVGVLEQRVDIKVFLILIIVQERGQQAPFFSEFHTPPCPSECGLNVSVHQGDLATCFIGSFHRCEQFSAGLLALVQTQFSLLSREHGLEQHHRSFALLDHAKQTFLVETAVVVQGIIAALAQFHRHNIGLEFSNLVTNRFNGRGCDVGGAEQPEAWCRINYGGI